MSGTDNIITIKSKYYEDNSITIQGPGAGKEVTASGVLVDLMKLYNIYG